MRIHRTGPLTWAQHMFWFYNDPFFFEDWGTEPRISRKLRLPDGVSIANLEVALAATAARHEALRTFYERPGVEEPRQVVLASYCPTITLGPPRSVEPVGIFERPGFRCHASVEGNAVESAKLVANLIDLDGASMAMVAREVEDFLLSGGPPDRPAVAADTTQPIDLAELEFGSNSSATERSQRAIRHFQRLRAQAPRNFLPSLNWKYGSGSTRSVSLRDRAILEAAKTVAARCRVTVPSVYHTAICKVVGDWTSTPRFLFSTAVANRWNRGLREYIGRLASPVDCLFELAPDATYRSVLRHTHDSLARAYLFANHNFGVYSMQSVRTDEETGSALAKPILIEYLDFLEGSDGSWLDGPLISTNVKEARTDHLWFNISPFRETVVLNVNSDAALLSEADAVEMLRQVVSFVQAAADEPDSPVHRRADRARPWGRSSEERWIAIGDSRFSANHIEANIEHCEGVSAAAVFTSEPDTLIAYAAGAHSKLVDIHERLLIESSHDPLIKIPSTYILTPQPPVSTKHETAWRELPEIDRFNAFADYSARVFVDDRFEVLKDAIIACNGPMEVNPVQSYGALGGRYLMISGVMELLRDGGYTGLDPGDFLGFGSMASLARRMRRVAPSPSDDLPAPVDRGV